MELKEIIKILKNNSAIIFSFFMIGGVVAGAIVLSQPVRYQGDFSVYLNEALSEKSLQNYNEFYALESLDQVSDLLVELGKSRSFKDQGLSVQLKKRTAIYSEGVLLSGSEIEAKKDFDDVIGMMTDRINELNKGIFSNNKIMISFSDFNAKEIKINSWRYFGAGIFGGLMTGIFIVFARYYFKEEK